MGKGQKLRLLCAGGDREALQPILDALRARGVSAAEVDGSRRGKDVLLAVLSENFYADEALKNALLGALGAGEEHVLPLRLDASEMPAEIKTALYARNIIPASERSAEQTAERVAAALPEKKNRMGAALIALAAVLAVLAGVLIWRALPKEETPQAVPAAATDFGIPEGIGLRAEDLQNIRSVIIVGDEYHFLPNSSASYGGNPSINDYATRANGQWFSKEDGHAFSMTRYDDLRFLALMPNLRNLSFALADIPELPDLSGAEIHRIEFADCTLDRLDWFNGEKLEEAELYNCPIRDFSPLSASSRAMHLEIELAEEMEADLSGFRPYYLSHFSMSGNPASLRMPDLSGMNGIPVMHLYGLPIEDLNFTGGCSARDVEIFDCERLRDISALADMPTLSILQIRNCDQIRDYSPIGACGSLQEILLDSRSGRIRDVSFLAGLNNLRSIRLYDCDIPDLSFLQSYAGKAIGLDFSFGGTCGDFSGLETVGKFDRLELDLWDRGFTGIAPYLENAQIDRLCLGNVQNLDLRLIPKDVTHLELHQCSFGQDLRALAGLSLSGLELDGIQTLTSLNGLRELNLFGEKGMGDLRLSDCPRLTDWSALEGMSINELSLRGVYTLPDFGSFLFHSLELDSLDWLEDLRCLDTLDGSYTGYLNFSLPGMDQIRDLSPIARVIRSGSLEVPPQLEEQARELQQQGKISFYSIVFPEGGWEMDRSELSLLSLDELNTLPGALLRRVTTLAVAGDTVYDPNAYEVWNRWENNRENFYLVERETREETPISMGAIRDLSAFSALTGLRKLSLCSQPLASLDDLESMEALELLDLKNCPELHDLSPAFAAQNLNCIYVDHTPAESIQGVQNLYRLQSLGINYTQVSDLSPLFDCDFGEAMQRGGFTLELDNIPCQDFSPLAAAGHYRRLNLNNLDCTLWLEAVRNCEIEQLDCVNTHIGNEELAELALAHPELRRLSISWIPELTDLTPLLGMESLEQLRLSRNMTKAIDSLAGKELPFQLEIEG